MQGRRALLLVLSVCLIAAGCSRGNAVSSTGTTPAAGTPTSTRPSNSTPSLSSKTPETNPAGDIPDNTVYLIYRSNPSLYEIKVPEGWARAQQGSSVAFTDKLNTVRVEVVPAKASPTPTSASATEVPLLQHALQSFQLSAVSTAQRKAGPAVLITYKVDSPPDPVTGKTVRDAVERYEFFRGGKEAVLTLSGPVGADNVDPWRIVTDSFRWVG